MNYKLVMVLSLFTCQSIYGVNVSFSQALESKNPSIHVFPGGEPHSFIPNKMSLDQERETYMTLEGTADEKLTFSGNWEYAKSSDATHPDWTPMSNIDPKNNPFVFERKETHSYKIRCTTKPAYSLTVTSMANK